MLDELTAALDGGDLAGLARGLWEDGQDAALKLYVTRQSLHFRGARAPSLRTATTPSGGARPLAEHVCAFARVADDAAR